MPGWRALDDLLRSVTNEVHTGATPPTQDQQTLIRDSIMHMFEPVIEVIERLRQERLLVPGNGYAPAPLPDAVTIKTALAGMHSPALVVPLDRLTTLTVRVATLRGKPYPEIITTARWRCVYTSNGVEVENKLFDNRNSMARWVMTQVLSFVNRPAASPMPPPLPQQSRDPAPSEYTGREHRVIMVDDPEE